MSDEQKCRCTTGSGDNHPCETCTCVLVDAASEKIENDVMYIKQPFDQKHMKNSSTSDVKK